MGTIVDLNDVRQTRQAVADAKRFAEIAALDPELLQRLEEPVRRALKLFDARCPHCGSTIDRWAFDLVEPPKPPPIEPHPGYHRVRWKCRDCGSVFKKFEVSGGE